MMVNPVPQSPSSVGLDRLYSAELPAVYGFLFRLGARGSDLEDLAHDVFVTAIRRWGSYDSSRPVRPWLLGIAFRVMSDHRRKSGAAREVATDHLELADEGPNPESRVADRERRELIDSALESLEPQRRAVFVLYELQGLTAPEISEAMSAPLATTYSRLRMGREDFTAAIRRIQLRRGEP